MTVSFLFDFWSRILLCLQGWLSVNAAHHFVSVHTGGHWAGCLLWTVATFHSTQALPSGLDFISCSLLGLSECLPPPDMFLVSGHGPSFMAPPPRVHLNRELTSPFHHFGHYNCTIVVLSHLTYKKECPPKHFLLTFSVFSCTFCRELLGNSLQDNGFQFQTPALHFLGNTRRSLGIHLPFPKVIDRVWR